jgi:acetolactate synthase regulatory subunit
VTTILPTVDTLSLAVHTIATTNALARVIAVLHSRGADVQQFTWTTDAGGCTATATLVVGLAEERHQHLRAALDRVVDVTEVWQHSGAGRRLGLTTASTGLVSESTLDRSLASAAAEDRPPMLALVDVPDQSTNGGAACASTPRVSQMSMPKHHAGR